MSEFICNVVRLKKIGKHPNADTLSIVQVNGCPVVFKSGDFIPGDLAVFVPVDAIVSTALPEFAWLDGKATAGEYRVKGTKIRGVPSMGILVPAHPDWTEGQTVGQFLGLKKYDPGPTNALQGDVLNDPNAAYNNGIAPYYDIEGLRKFSDKLIHGEDVWVTEKLHGTNGRWIFSNGQLLSGSRTKWRQNSVWNRMAVKYKLEDILSRPENAGLCLYGEIVGPGIQDLSYGLKEQFTYFFDAYDSANGKWLSVVEFCHFCIHYGLPIVPTLYCGPFSHEDTVEMAEGYTTLMADGHVREGVVVKPMRERWDKEIGRVFLKLPGNGYLLRKDAALTNVAELLPGQGAYL